MPRPLLSSREISGLFGSRCRDDQETYLYDTASSVRRAIDTCKGETQGTDLALLARFPKGSCSVASQLLGRFLVDRCQVPVRLVRFSVNGTRKRVRGKWQPARPFDPGSQTHAWIEVGDTIVDITADQFDDGPGKVVVTQDRTWHGLFSRPDFRSHNEFMDFNEHFARDFDEFYSLLVNACSAPHSPRS